MPHIQPQATAHGSALPRGAVPGAAALVCFSLLAVTTARFMHWQATPLPAASPVTVLHLSFRDRPNGAVEVLDAERLCTRGAAGARARATSRGSRRRPTLHAHALE